MRASGGAVVLLGTPIDDVTMPEALERIAEMVETGRATGRVHQVATVNVDFVVNASQDRSVLGILGQTDLAIPDGMGIVWGARLIGVPIRERTSGVDLVPALAERAAVAGWRICLFGGRPGVAERAAQMLRDRYPGAEVAGLPAPAVSAEGDMDTAALEPIRSFAPDIVGVALGNPKQERWIARHGAALGAPVFIGIGGSLDFLTGVTQRAPDWMQRWGVEWVHRAMSEPRRLAARYAKDLVVYGPGILRQAWRGRARMSARAPVTTDADGARTVRLLGRTLAPTVREVAADGHDVRLDLTALDRVDNATLAAVVAVVRRSRRRGSRVDLIGISPALAAEAARLGGAHLLRRPA